jgi:hypothetical protein
LKGRVEKKWEFFFSSLFIGWQICGFFPEKLWDQVSGHFGCGSGPGG